MSGPRRIPEIQARLDQWAIWCDRTASGGGGRSDSWLAHMVDMAAGRRVHDGDRTYGCEIPVDNIECSRTNDAVKALPLDLRQAVGAWHGARTGTLDEVARRLGVVKTTLWRRLAQADRRIAEWLATRQHRNI